jgi:hypothetical protein
MYHDDGSFVMSINTSIIFINNNNLCKRIGSWRRSMVCEVPRRVTVSNIVIISLQLLAYHQIYFILFLSLFSVEGLIMDQFCIDLGFLLDNPSVQTLVNPVVHSVHWYDFLCNTLQLLIFLL